MTEWNVKTLNLREPYAISIAACWSLAVVLLIWAWGIQVSYSDFQFVENAGVRSPKSIELPFLEVSPKAPATYIFEGNINVGFLSPGQFRIIPDDLLMQMTVNGRDVDLSSVPRDKLRDVVNGFSLDLGDYLKSGANSVQIRLWDQGGMMGVSIQKQGVHSWMLLVLAALLIVFPPISPWLAREYNLSQVTATQGLLYGLILAGNLLQIWLIVEYNPVDHIWSDPGRHWEQGTEPLRVDLMSMTDPIMYQLYIGALGKLTLKLPVLVAFYTSLLAVWGHWIWYRFFRELQSNKTIALAGWAIVSLLPSWSSIYSYFMQETLLLPLLGASLWATWRARRKGDLRSFLLMVTLWIAAGLTRGVAIPLAAVCCTWLWLEQGLKMRKAVFSVLILLLALGPLTYRSYQTVHLFAPHGMGHLNNIYSKSGKREIVIHTRKDGSRWTHIFGSPSVGAKPFEPLSDWMTEREGRVEISVDLNKGSEDWKKASENIEMTWDKYLRLTKEGLAFLFFSPSWPDGNSDRLVDSINIHMRWIWAPLLLLALVGLVVMRRKLRGSMMLPALMLAWFIVQGLLPIAVAEGRYRKPLEGLLISQYVLFAAAAVGAVRKVPYRDSPANSWLQGRWRKLRGANDEDDGAPAEVDTDQPCRAPA